MLARAGNDFRGSPILSVFGQFKNLVYLDLSVSNLSSNVPLEISYLSKLVSFQLIEVDSDNIIITISGATFKALAQNLNNLREHLGSIDWSSLASVCFMKLSSSLTSIFLCSSKLRAELPEKVFWLPKLQVLNIIRNEGTYWIVSQV